MAVWGRQNGQPVVLPVEDVLEDLYPNSTPTGFDEKTFTVFFNMENGKPNKLNLKEYYNKMAPILKQAGASPITVTKATAFNQQDNPLPESSINFLDRLRMSFSVNQDRPYGIKNIRKDIQDAQMTGDGSLVVKEKGIWKRVDPQDMDPGDVADMIGYLIPLGLGGAALSATTPAAPATAGIVPTLASFGAGMVGEGIREGIGTGMGVKKPGVHVPSVAFEGASWLAAPGVNKLIGKTWAGPIINKGKKLGKFMIPEIGGVKEGIKHLSSFVFEITSGVPKEVTMYVLEHPEVLKESLPALKGQLTSLKNLPKKPTKIKLPSGKIYTLSTKARDALLGALEETGKEIEKVVSNSPKIKDLRIDKNEFLGDLLANPEKMINEHWGGVDKFTPKQRAFIVDLSKDLERKAGTQNIIGVDPAALKGPIPTEGLPVTNQEFVSFEKLHNLKQKIYSFLDFDAEGNAGDVFLLDYAGKINEILGSKVPEYKVANEAYGGFKNLSKKFFAKIPYKEDKVAMQKATEGISKYMNSLASGKAKPSQETVLGELEKLTGVKVKTSAQGIFETGKAKMEKELADIEKNKSIIGALENTVKQTTKAQSEFNKPPQLNRAFMLNAMPMLSGLSSVISGGSPAGLAGAGAGLLTSSPLTWPQLTGKAISGVSAASKFLQPLAEKTIGKVTPNQRSILSKTLIDLLGKKL